MLLEIKFQKCCKIAQEPMLVTSDSAESDLHSC